MSESVTDLDAKRRALMPWLWTATVFAMLTSLGEGTTLMMGLGAGWYIAVLFPLASDVGLIASLRGSAALSHAGLDVRAARPLRWFSSLFCLALNTGGSLMAGHWVAALFHAGIPALVITLATFEERYAAEFSALIRDQREAARKAAEAKSAEAAREEAERAELVAQAARDAAARQAEAEQQSPEPEAAKRTTERVTPPATPRRTDEELLPELVTLADNLGKRPTRREVQAALRVSPQRAGRLLSALDASATAAPSAAYL